MKKAIAAGSLLSFGFAAEAAEPPETAISNGAIRARVYLPDPKTLDQLKPIDLVEVILGHCLVPPDDAPAVRPLAPST